MTITPDTAKIIDRVIGQVVRGKISKEVNYSQDDLIQEGWAITLDALRKGSYNPSRGTLNSWLYRVLLRRLGTSLASWISPVTLTRTQLENGTVSHVVSNIPVTDVTIPVTNNFLADLIDTPRFQTKLARGISKSLTHFRVEDVPLARFVVHAYYGLDTGTPKTAGQISRESGLDRRRINYVIRSFHKRAARDPGMKRLLKDLSEHSSF